MKKNLTVSGITLLFLLAAITFLLTPETASSHCDTLDGPVVKTARAALEKGDVTPVLKWVKPEQEGEIREAFNRTLAVRKLGPDAKELADTSFFETLVRLHRAGEGAPYTGLKPAGEVEPPIAAADKALETGSVDGLIKDVQHEAEVGIREKYERVVETAKHKDESVEAGREYVEAYVTYAHYVEGIHNAIIIVSSHHGEAEAGETGAVHTH